MRAAAVDASDVWRACLVAVWMADTFVCVSGRCVDVGVLDAVAVGVVVLVGRGVAVGIGEAVSVGGIAAAWVSAMAVWTAWADGAQADKIITTSMAGSIFFISSPFDLWLDGRGLTLL